MSTYTCGEVHAGHSDRKEAVQLVSPGILLRAQAEQGCTIGGRHAVFSYYRASLKTTKAAVMQWSLWSWSIYYNARPWHCLLAQCLEDVFPEDVWPVRLRRVAQIGHAADSGRGDKTRCVSSMYFAQTLTMSLVWIEAPAFEVPAPSETIPSRRRDTHKVKSKGLAPRPGFVRCHSIDCLQDYYTSLY